MQVKLLLDHREDLVKARSEDQCRLRWHLHDLWPELEIPAGALDRMRWLERVARKLARAEQSARVRVPASWSPRSAAAPAGPPSSNARSGPGQSPGAELLALEGCGALTAAKLIAETAGAKRLRLRRQVRPPGRRRPDPRLLGQARSATASTAAATASSTAPCTASPSPRAACQPRPASSWPKAGRGQVQNRSPALPQAPPRAPSLEAVGQFRKEISMTTVDTQRDKLAPQFAVAA